MVLSIFTMTPLKKLTEEKAAELVHAWYVDNTAIIGKLRMTTAAAWFTMSRPELLHGSFKIIIDL